MFCSRDRFGVKPFYYYYDSNYFIFASEIKALLTLPFISNEVDNSMIYNYLLWNLTEDKEKTFYKNIKRLLHSHNLIVDLNSKNLHIYKYYHLNFNPNFGNYDDAKAKELAYELKEHISNAIKIRLRSDVPIGSCLSGGLDSSFIYMLINNLLKEKKGNDRIFNENSQKAFTSCFLDKRYDESNFAEQIINMTMTKSDWFKIFPNSDELWEGLDNLVKQHDEPFGSTSIYTQYIVL